MKQLLKLLTLTIALGTINFSSGQMTVSISGANQLSEDGFFMNNGVAADLIIVVDNIPDPLSSYTNSQIRLIEDGSANITGAGLATNFFFSIDPAEADVSGDPHLNFITTGSGNKTRTFNITSLNQSLSGLLSGADKDVDLVARFVMTDASGTAFTGYDALTNGDNRYGFVHDITIRQGITLSNSKFDNISKGIYPNPVTTELTISNSIKTNSYEVVNMLGKTVKEVKATGRMDVSDLTSGIYLLVTDSGVAKFVKK